MWNKGFGLLWLHIKVAKEKKVSFSMPISLYALTELLDCFSDLLAVTGIFFHKTTACSISVPAGRVLVDFSIELLESLSIGESYELVNVTVDKVKVVIEVK